MCAQNHNSEVDRRSRHTLHKFYLPNKKLFRTHFSALQWRKKLMKKKNIFEAVGCRFSNSNANKITAEASVEVEKRFSVFLRTWETISIYFRVEGEAKQKKSERWREDSFDDKKMIHFCCLYTFFSFFLSKSKIDGVDEGGGGGKLERKFMNFLLFSHLPLAHYRSANEDEIEGKLGKVGGKNFQ